jgi:hypothetical protein
MKSISPSNRFTNLYTLQITYEVYVFTSRCLVTAPNNIDSSASVIMSLLDDNSSWPQLQLPASTALCSIGTDRKENTALNSSSIIVAGRCLAITRLFMEPFPRKGQCLSSHMEFAILIQLVPFFEYLPWWQRKFAYICAYLFRHFCPPVFMWQLESRWTDYRNRRHRRVSVESITIFQFELNWATRPDTSHKHLLAFSAVWRLLLAHVQSVLFRFLNTIL